MLGMGQKGRNSRTDSRGQRWKPEAGCQVFIIHCKDRLCEGGAAAAGGNEEDVSSVTLAPVWSMSFRGTELGSRKGTCCG